MVGVLSSGRMSARAPPPPPPLAPSPFTRPRWAYPCWVIFLLVSTAVQAQIVAPFENPKTYHIGAVLSSGDNIAHFTQVIEDVKYEPNLLPPDVNLESVTVPMNPNPIRTAQSVCEKLITAQVYAVIISHPASGELSPASVSYTCGFYNIPVIGISSRDSSLSDKNLHASFMRTVPPYSHQSDVWIQILRFMDYKCATFIHSSDNDGRSTLGRFQYLADSNNVKVENIIEYEPGITDIASGLQEARNLNCRVFILYANTEDAEGIFREMDQLNMTDPGFVWIVSEQALTATNKPDGLLSLVLVNASDEASHIRDSVFIVALALRELFHRENITEAPKDCSNLGRFWETGIKFVNYLRMQSLLYGRTGRVAFDDKGDRLNSDYEVVNVVGGQIIPVGQYVFSKASMAMELNVNVKDIIWPGNLTVKPPGYIVPKHLRVVTIAEKPFVWTRSVEDESQCLEGELPCPLKNSTDGTMYMYCCRGYCMDLLKDLSSELNFTYSLYQVEDGQYGSQEFVNGSKEKEWTGMVGELVKQAADLIVAPLTINPERSTAIEFSKPFKYQGITILEKTQPRQSTLASFLQPFHKTLWILVMVSVHVVALALYLLDRFSPFGRYKLPNSDSTEEDALNLSSAIWFAWGVLLNSGIGEGTPRSFSARVLGMVWAGFAMIVVASYTANLAAFLVLDRPETSLTGINDARLRNPMDNFTYATVKGSAVDMYFRRQVELSNMYRTMEGKNYDSAEKAIEAVKSEELSAFIWDSSRLEYEAAQDCDLKTAGEQFGRSGYGIGLQKNSYWSDDITLALLKMHEKGAMEELDNKWILQGGTKCNNRHEKFPATLGLKNMAGVFILVGAGIVGGVGLIIIEIIYKKHQTRKQRRLELARHAADKWRGAVEGLKRKDPNLHPQSHMQFNHSVPSSDLENIANSRDDIFLSDAEIPVEDEDSKSSTQDCVNSRDNVFPSDTEIAVEDESSSSSTPPSSSSPYQDTRKPPPYSMADPWLRISQSEKRKTLRATLQAQKRLKANGMEAFTIEKGMMTLGGSAFPTSSSTLSFERHAGLHEPPPPPPPPRWVPPPLDRCSPLVDSLRTTPEDHDFHHGIPPPPPPPASSPAIRMRSGRVTYINPGGAYDIPV